MHLHYAKFEVVSRTEINFDSAAVNRICAERGAVDGVCLKSKVTQQHDGKTGIGYEAYIPMDNALAVGNPVNVGDEYIVERGQYKDTISALPGQITRIRALFDRRGRYVWHCHTVSHEDHEMMRLFEVV
jgi:FtsP/CotA-like multicopper oxidase with cupredoxin domain